MKYDPLNEIICRQGCFFISSGGILLSMYVFFQAVIHCLIEYRATILYKRGKCNRIHRKFYSKVQKTLKNIQKM